MVAVDAHAHFRHAILGTLVTTPTRMLVSTYERTHCELPVDALREVADAIDPLVGDPFELYVLLHGGRFAGSRRIVSREEMGARLVERFARDARLPCVPYARHGFVWYVVGDDLALVRNEGLHVFVRSPSDVPRWVDAIHQEQARVIVPRVRARPVADTSSPGPWHAARDAFRLHEEVRFATSGGGVLVDHARADGGRLVQRLVGHRCVAEDAAVRAMDCAARVRDALASWCVRRVDEEGPARVERAVRLKGGSAALARRAAEAEARYGGLERVDGVVALSVSERVEQGTHLAPSPAGPTVFLAPRVHGALAMDVAIAEDGSLWCSSDFIPDEEWRAADDLDTFVARLAMWGHPYEGLERSDTRALAGPLVEALGLRDVPEASDSTGTLWVGPRGRVLETRDAANTGTWFRPHDAEGDALWCALGGRA